MRWSMRTIPVFFPAIISRVSIAFILKELQREFSICSTDKHAAAHNMRVSPGSLVGDMRKTFVVADIPIVVITHGFP